MKKDILSKILSSTYQWIEYKKNNIPLNYFKNKIIKSNNCFENALKKKPAFILECKKSSPLNGIIRKNYNISQIISIYNKYADVISVITEEKYFHGNFQYLLQARKQTKKPLLCKDFFIDPYQVYYARYHQADAILLMLSILDDDTYRKLSDVAKSMNLGILTEVHTLEELKRALYLNATVIGINNRNLNNLSVSIKNTEIIAPLIPRNKIIICESGIQSYQEIRKLSKIVHGFLIGTYLMRSKDLELRVRKIIYGDNKICGLTDKNSAKSAKKYGCIYGGLIFVSHSLRNVTDLQAEKIITNSSLNYVGVFCNSNYKYILTKVKKFNLYAVQLHGLEDRTFIKRLRKYLPENVRIWKSISVNKDTVIKKNKYIDRYVLDNESGGTGKMFDWNLTKKFNVSNMMLAGGLTLHNTFLASTLGFKGLDFNSGLEKSPGLKDSKKIKSIFEILRFYLKK